MIVDLINVTLEDIEESTNRCTKEADTLIMYLQNNGDKNYRLKEEDISAWLYEDIDD
ncbi:MAG: hypothetical protein J1G06_07035 [Oscillospiraceae bacterium]|nr:hypothetical protein [Oscillospiraceae bacterium]